MNSNAIQWTGKNFSDIEKFVGIMENMDGDVSTCRFLPGDLLDDEGMRRFTGTSPRLWVEATHRWTPVGEGMWIIEVCRHHFIPTLEYPQLPLTRTDRG